MVVIQYSFLFFVNKIQTKFLFFNRNLIHRLVENENVETLKILLTNDNLNANEQAILQQISYNLKIKHFNTIHYQIH